MSANSPAAPASTDAKDAAVSEALATKVAESKVKPKARVKAKPQATAKTKAAGIPAKEGWYTVGLRSSNGQPPPRHAVTFGGISFPEFSYDENPTVKNETLEYNQKRDGQRIYLDSFDLTALRTAVGKRIVRTRSEKTGRYFIMSVGAQHHRPLKGDIPLEKFLYITPDSEPVAAADLAEDAPDAIG